MAEYDGLSPYIADSLRRAKMEKEQERVLRKTLDDIGMSEEVARNLQSLRAILGEKSAYESSVRAKDLIVQRERHKRRPQSPSGRASIYERDEGKCYICGVEVAFMEMYLDHVLPLARGGSNRKDNLRVCCGRCNSAKGAMTLSEYLATLDRTA